MADKVTPLFKKPNMVPVAGAPLAQMLMDAGYLCHTMTHLEQLADSYNVKDPVAALALYDAIINITEAANAICEKARA